MPLKIELILEACLANADHLLESAKAARSVPGCNHIAFNLAVLALEEIGKSMLLFQESLELERVTRNGGEPKRPLEWIDDHERKLFWAFWFGDACLDWRTIPTHMDLARKLHLQRLRVLYYDPTQPGAQAEIADGYLSSVISMADARLHMERTKKYRDLSEEDRADIQWFFLASADPQLKPVVFSQASMAKQAEFTDGSGWIKWLRKTVEDSQRAAHDIVQKEMARTTAEDGDLHVDKWKLRIKLQSWSHSIRQNQLQQWNEHVQFLKLHKGGEHNELTVDFIMPKAITVHQLWNAGMHNCVIFVSCLNIASLGYFWFYLPRYVSRFHESITDLESNCEVIIDRVPMLKASWPQQALKNEVLEQPLQVIFGFIAKARGDQFAVYHKYFGTLALTAKNDLFFQFEHHLVHDFIECLEMALKAYGDWDGSPSAFGEVIKRIIPDKEGSEEFVVMVMDLRRIAEGVNQRTLKEPVTLDQAIKAKIAFDTYIQIKARAYFEEEIARGNLKPDAASQ